MHLHLHLILRAEGNVEAPRGPPLVLPAYGALRSHPDALTWHREMVLAGA